MAIFVSLRFRMDESRAQIQKIQMRDPLTNLYNQESFRRQVAKVLAQADPEQYSNTAAALAAKTISDKGTAQSSGGRHGKRRKQV